MRPLVVATVAIALAAQSAPAWRALQLESFDVAWQTIHETFYDASFGGVDWPGVRDELRPRVAEAATRDEARAVIRDMLGRLGRSHIALMSDAPAAAGGGPAVVPFEVRVVDDIPLVVRVDDGASVGVRPGDALEAIDGTRVAALLADAAGPNPRARAFDAWRRVDNALRGASGSRVSLSVRRGDAAVDVQVERRRPEGEVVQFGNLPELWVEVEHDEVRTPGGRRVGVIGFNVWMAAIDEPVASAVDRFRGYDGLVIDLRGNPGGIAGMIRGIAGHVIDEEVVLGRMRTRQARLEFPVNPRRVTSDGRAVTPFAGPVAILVDGLTASTSECFAGALQSLGRARVFGRQTIGMALPALTRRLPSGDVLMYAVGDFETATGQPLEGDGVIPDEVVALSPGRLAGGGDPDLEAALRWFDRF